MEEGELEEDGVEGGQSIARLATEEGAMGM